jgi:tripartite-type tricarboxylate transporter receptor subunit TctC
MTRILAVIAVVAVWSAGAFAAEWPGKPVRVVVPFAAGGAADTIGRLHADALTAAFGKQFYVENRVGGGGLVGTEAVARAEPDGLTLMVSGIPTHVLGPAMNKNVGFDPMRDFTHIAYFGGTPNVLVAHPSLGVTTYGDFLALARNADGIEYVSAGFGTMGNWIAEFLAAKQRIGRTAPLEVSIGRGLAAMASLPALPCPHYARREACTARNLAGPRGTYRPPSASV